MPISCTENHAPINSLDKMQSHSTMHYVCNEVFPEQMISCKGETRIPRSQRGEVVTTGEKVDFRP